MMHIEASGESRRPQRVEKVFSPRCADFETFKKSFKILLIERAVGFLPPAHTPRCSVPDIFSEVQYKAGGLYIAHWTTVSHRKRAQPGRCLS